MSQGPEDCAAAMKHAVTVLASACGPEDGAWAGRFEQAISAGDSEAVQVAQLSKVLCSFTFEEGISVEFSEALTPTSNDSLHSGRQNALATDVVRDDVFLSLVKHATTTDAVCWLSHAMRRIITGDDDANTRRRDVLATELVRDGFFVQLVRHATSPEAVYSLSRAMCNITAGTDAGAARRKDMFATEAARDGFFLPLVKHATSAEACRWLCTAMYNITRGPDDGAARRQDLFATKAVRDGFFVPLVTHATSAEAVDWLSSAMCNITRGTDAGAARRSDMFATEAVRDGFFVPLVTHATSAEACRWLSRAMCNITHDADPGAARRQDMFATEAVRDGFFFPLVKHATSAEACQWLSSAMCNITTGTDAGAARRKDIFATEAVRDGFFFPLVKHAPSSDSVQWLSNACASVSRCNATPFATAEMCDCFFLPLARAVGTNSVAAADTLLTAFSTVAQAVGVSPKKLVTATVATEFLRLLDSFEGLSATALSVRDLLAESYPLLLHPLVSNAAVTKTVISKDTQLFWELEDVLNAGINGQNDDYVQSRTSKGKRPLTFILVGARAVSNPVLEKRFEVMKSMLRDSGRCSGKELRERCSFHGTHPKNIDGILTTSLLPHGHSLNPCTHKSDDGNGGFSGAYHLNSFFETFYKTEEDFLQNEIFHVSGVKNDSDSISRDTEVGMTLSVVPATDFVFPALATFNHPFGRQPDRPWWNW